MGSMDPPSSGIDGPLDFKANRWARRTPNWDRWSSRVVGLVPGFRLDPKLGPMFSASVFAPS